MANIAIVQINNCMKCTERRLKGGFLAGSLIYSATLLPTCATPIVYHHHHHQHRHCHHHHHHYRYRHHQHHHCHHYHHCHHNRHHQFQCNWLNCAASLIFNLQLEELTRVNKLISDDIYTIQATLWKRPR